MRRRPRAVLGGTSQAFPAINLAPRSAGMSEAFFTLEKTFSCHSTVMHSRPSTITSSSGISANLSACRMPVSNIKRHIKCHNGSVSKRMSWPACAGDRIFRSLYTTRGASARSHGLLSSIPSLTASSRALCSVRHALPAVAVLLGLRPAVSSPLTMNSSSMRKCRGSSLPIRTPPIAGLMSASTTDRYVATVDGRSLGATISVSHRSSQSDSMGVTAEPNLPVRSYSSFFSLRRARALALVLPLAVSRRRAPVAGSGGSSQAAR